MATDVARRCGMLVPQMRIVGLDAAAFYCGLIRVTYNYAGGVDSDDSGVSPRGKPAAISASNKKLAMRKQCSKLEQGSRGAQRFLRGRVQIRGNIQSHQFFSLERYDCRLGQKQEKLQLLGGLVDGLRGRTKRGLGCTVTRRLFHRRIDSGMPPCLTIFDDAKSSAAGLSDAADCSLLT